MTKPNSNKMHRGIAILLIVMVNALGIEFVEGKSLKHLKKGIAKTIECHESGDVIDCVGIHDQPAFNHPFLKNHTIQMKRTSYPRGRKIKKFHEKVLTEVECPEGTIPIMRTQNHISGRVLSIVSKAKLFYNHNYDIKKQYPPYTGHEYAQVSLAGGTFFGARAVINVWNPTTEYGEISISQIWVFSGSGDNLNTIEAGWMVDPQEYGNEARFFVYWTADNYINTGCYNLKCPGFVQVSKKYIVGAIIRPASRYNSKQHNIDITIHQDQKTKNWWLQLNNEDIGYWPASIFTTMGGGAKSINWGGEILNSEAKHHHTTTQMGSGHFPFEGFGKASYFLALKYIDISGKQIDADGLTKYVSNSACYDVQLKQKKRNPIGVYFYYGGPGYSAKCP